LPIPAEDGFVTCEYCGVRTEVSSLVPPQRLPTPPEETFPPLEPPLQSTGDDLRSGSPSYIARIVIAIVVIVIVIAVFAASQPQSSPAGSGSPVAHCSVTINASATSGPAPFTATFTAEITAPPGDSTSEPMWQFGPFPPGFDLNFTYGSTVTHTWTTSGSYGVHVSVPDSSLEGCFATMSVNVT
jgi:hypothetical protein